MIRDPVFILFEKTGKDGSTEYAYAYAGTDSNEDIAEDGLQLAGMSPQYALAVINARILDKELGDSELSFVGHSLGGGEAAAASMATGRDAITFNPAAVSPLTRLSLALWKDSNIDNYISSTPQILGMNFTVDPVTLIQGRIPMHPNGNIIPVPVGYWFSHGIKNIKDKLKK